MTRSRSIMLPLALGLAWGLCGSAATADGAQPDLRPPAPAHFGNRIEALEAALAAGRSLYTDERFGYLPAVLDALEISPDSQTLVFSKTSFQQHAIDPDHPRAIYFNDDTYVGWVPDSTVLELCAADPAVGARFYTLSSPETPPTNGSSPAIERASRLHQRPRLRQDAGRCVGCHDNARTRGVPGFLMRSVICDPRGRFVPGAPTFVIDHTTSFAMRWGGWYVTGTHGAARHLGNGTCDDPTASDWFDREACANRLELPARIGPDRYLRPTSDIIALMVLAHETQMHNHLTRLATAGRGPALPEVVDSVLEDRALETVRYLLFVDEPLLSAAIQGAGGYAAWFQAQGPRDGKGRSLRDIDGSRYLFNHPCSFLIHSQMFDSLPERSLVAIGRLLRAVLLEGAASDWPRPTTTERRALCEILAATKPHFWSTFVSATPDGEPPQQSIGNPR